MKIHKTADGQPMTRWKPESICPNCEHEIDCTYELFLEYEDDIEHICEGCGANLCIEREVDVTYDTTAIDKEHGGNNGK